ncbi:hypothetical protein FHW67_000900 [Herbaspirillum sp. Sphag1AN]|uniref:hypothetical protein n=1 Tax=unclassified Herbaspirillum TaxID=2624150 RepID=UPI001613399A|nr:MULTISPECIES: hypothetical protein [unclassified Herbaspirillum]MBB3211652.1 hypothetical protein [Herbaspirillum sp. Sphag1AN]MBB3245080.1 hypothetical protein [Herbaspirillum sp. Sphag64]
MATGNHKEFVDGEWILVVDYDSWKIKFFAFSIPLIIFCVFWLIYQCVKKYPIFFSRLFDRDKNNYLRNNLFSLIAGLLIAMFFVFIFKIRIYFL